MILPDLDRLLTSVHEAAHFVIADALGVTHTEVTAVPGPADDISDGHTGRCVYTPGQSLPVRHHLLILLAGATATARRFPGLGALAVAGAYDDFVKADALVVRHFAEEDRPAAREASHEAAQLAVAELWPEICRTAEQLYTNGRLGHPEQTSAPGAA